MRSSQTIFDVLGAGCYNFFIYFRDEGIISTYSAIENATILEEWKQNWREGGYGALRLFGVEYGMQASSQRNGFYVYHLF